VKNFFRKGSFDEMPDNPFLPDVKEKIFEPVFKKPVTAGNDELKRNSRSRSAKLRVVERL
jgi:16S rRNA (cytosine1402-N4)-methyltransferase